MAVGVIRGGQVDLWPDWDQPLDGLALVVISVSDDPGTVSTDLAIRGPRAGISAELRAPSRYVVIGWNEGGPGLVDALERELGDLLTAVDVVVPAVPDDAADVGDRVRWTIVPSDELQGWLDDPQSMLRCDHAIVLSDTSRPPAVADAETLLTLLALRPPGRGDKPDTVVAELRERASRHLVTSMLVDDLIINDAFAATLLAQQALRREMSQVVDELLRHEVRIALAEPGEYLGAESSRSFRDITVAAARRGEIAVGVRPVPNGSVLAAPLVNPGKDEVFAAATSGAAAQDGPTPIEKVIVLSRGARAGAVGPEPAASAEEG